MNARLLRSISRLAVGAVAVGAVAGCAGNLTTEFLQWSVAITSPLVQERVPFCPAIVSETDGGAALPLDGSFAVPAGLRTSFNVQDEDVYTFVGATDVNFVGVSGTMATLMSTPMVFDLGPIGTVYDLGDPVITAWGGVRAPTSPTTGVNITRTLVGGGRKDEGKVELVYDYSLDCTAITVVDDAGNPQTCECEDRAFTFSFEGTK